MDEQAKEALGERAVKCSGFRWLAGMLCLPGKGSSVGGRYLGDEGDGFGNVGYRDGTCAFKVNSWLPDLSDPATLGCLLALVREAWGAGFGSLVLAGEDACITCSRVPIVAGSGVLDVLSELAIFQGPLAEALVDALGAAPLAPLKAEVSDG